jgi:uncharacterized protein YjiS (DUF1127 family)
MSAVLQERQYPFNRPKLKDQVPAQRATSRHEPAAAVANRQVEAPPARWRLILGLIVATLRDWHRRRRERSELARLDTRALRDIGLDPGTVDYEMNKPFWRPIRNWRD